MVFDDSLCVVDGMTPDQQERQHETSCKVLAIILGVLFFLFALSVALGLQPVGALREMIQATFR
jgi:hypothetical protein